MFVGKIPRLSLLNPRRWDRVVSPLPRLPLATQCPGSTRSGHSCHSLSGECRVFKMKRPESQAFSQMIGKTTRTTAFCTSWAAAGRCVVNEAEDQSWVVTLPPRFSHDKIPRSASAEMACRDVTQPP